MEVNFDLVRIGSPRKSFLSEKDLEGRVKKMKYKIRELLKNEVCSHKNNKEDVTMIIPGKGLNVKILLQDFKDTHIRRIIRANMPEAIYSGNQEKILENINNRVFR